MRYIVDGRAYAVERWQNNSRFAGFDGRWWSLGQRIDERVDREFQIRFDARL